MDTIKRDLDHNINNSFLLTKYLIILYIKNTLNKIIKKFIHNQLFKHLIKISMHIDHTIHMVNKKLLG